MLEAKSANIQDAIAQLRLRLGARAFDLVDLWGNDPHNIGIARPGEEEPCVCVVTAGKADGRFDVEYGGTVYRDCVIEGLLWAVQEGLLTSTRTKR